MRFKLDENLPLELAELFRRSGHDAQTVFDEGLAGAEDADIASVAFANAGPSLRSTWTSRTSARTHRLSTRES